MFKLLILFVITTLVNCSDKNNLEFPHGFLVGVASSAYQVEGAWNVSDKAISIWDHYVHSHPNRIADGSNADITTNSYYKYKEDMDILQGLGVDHYRFSISWSRLLPKGHAGYISKTALRYYHTILDELKDRGIIPFVTIYHWDHPQSIEEKGGWLSDNMPVWFADYARVVFKYFGHRVKYFMTINELSIFCRMAYDSAMFSPARIKNGTSDYLCLHNQLKAHALAYQMYNRLFRREQKGQIGIVYQCKGAFNKDENNADSDDLAFEFECGWQAHPVFSLTGDYPKVMKEKVAKRSRAQGYKVSRLPEFSKDWINLIKGSADFLGLNYYTSRLVKALPESSIANWPNDEGLEYSIDPKWHRAQAEWLWMVPEGLEMVLKNIKDKYNNPAVYITENGMACGQGLKDNNRVYYIDTHLKAVLRAIGYGCNVKGYTYWSLLDSYEWNYGYTNQFGLMQVNFSDPNRTRTPKKSVVWFKNVIKTRKLDPANFTYEDNKPRHEK